MAVGRLEYWNSIKNFGFIEIRKPVGEGRGSGYWVERFYLALPNVLFVDGEIQINCWVKFTPGPKGPKPLALDAEIWSTSALAVQADHARPGISRDLGGQQ